MRLVARKVQKTNEVPWASVCTVSKGEGESERENQNIFVNRKDENRYTEKGDTLQSL